MVKQLSRKILLARQNSSTGKGLRVQFGYMERKEEKRTCLIDCVLLASLIVQDDPLDQPRFVSEADKEYGLARWPISSRSHRCGPGQSARQMAAPLLLSLGLILSVYTNREYTKLNILYSQLDEQNKYSISKTLPGAPRTIVWFWELVMGKRESDVEMRESSRRQEKSDDFPKLPPKLIVFSEQYLL